MRTPDKRLGQTQNHNLTFSGRQEIVTNLAQVTTQNYTSDYETGPVIGSLQPSLSPYFSLFVVYRSWRKRRFDAAKDLNYYTSSLLLLTPLLNLYKYMYIYTI